LPFDAYQVLPSVLNFDPHRAAPFTTDRAVRLLTSSPA
jgi:hypothetical protein